MNKPLPLVLLRSESTSDKRAKLAVAASNNVEKNETINQSINQSKSHFVLTLLLLVRITYI